MHRNHRTNMTEIENTESTAVRNHELFLSEVRKSESAVFTVAEHLHLAGYPVRINVFPITDRSNRQESYHDNGDLEISQRIEVKRLSYQFTSADNWPFADFLIVDAKHFERTRPVPFAYWSLNPEGTHAAIVRVSTRPKWFIKKHTDRRYGDYSQDSYACHLDCVKFIQLKRSNL